MDFDAERAGVIQLVKVTLDQHGHGHRFARNEIQVSWDLKMTFAVAQAGCLGTWTKHDPRLSYEIRLSRPLWPTLDHRDRYETVLHELAHVLVAELHGPHTDKEDDGHGPIWKAQMRLFGISPKHCLRSDPGIKATCDCQIRYVPFPTANQVFMKLRAGGQYRCRTCKQIIKFEYGL